MQLASCATLAAMEDVIEVQREVELDVDAGALWSLIGDGDGWAQWLVDDADVDVEPGGGGAVEDGGVVRQVRVDEVVDGERATFRWWPHDDPGSMSSVEFVVAPSTDGGARLRVVERLGVTPDPRRARAAALAWEVRATVLWSCARAALLVA